MVEPTEIRCYQLDDITELLARPEAIEEDIPSTPHLKNVRFWHRFVSDRNKVHGLPGSITRVDQFRTLDVFQEVLGQFLFPVDRDGLRVYLEKWIENLGAIEDKVGKRFNHWDDDDASGRAGERSGLAWTAALLEHCRSGGRLAYLDTQDRDIDFALVAMDVNLVISSRVNPIPPKSGNQESIKPDGLGVRRDGGLSVVEVKAEGDREDMFRATIQALCGASAIVAKRDMILRILRQGAGRRPATPHAALSIEEPSIDLCIVAAANHYKQVGADEPEALSSIVALWPPLKRIIYFQADRSAAGFPAQLPIAAVIE